MKRIRRRLVLPTLCLLAGVGWAWSVSAGDVPGVVVTVHDGDPVLRILPPDRIPAIRRPEILSGEKADAQMSRDEPVLGLVVGRATRAYSLWHLDAHEIVNDTIGGIAIAATW